MYGERHKPRTLDKGNQKFIQKVRYMEKLIAECIKIPAATEVGRVY